MASEDAGEWLPGGNVGGAWRVGDTVRRAVGPWTPAVHALLDFLGPRLAHVPAALGFDGNGQEVVSFLPGRVVDIDNELLTDGQLRSLVGWTRCFHGAVASFRHPGPWRFQTEESTLICHNDIAPYNVCFDGDDLAGVFDWDIAGPSTPRMELAFVAWNCVPLWRDIGAETAAERLEIIASTYGSWGALEVLYAVPERIEAMLRWIPSAAAAGDSGMANLMAAGEPDRSRASLHDLRLRIPGIAAMLRRQ